MERIVTDLTGIRLEESDEVIRILKEQALMRDIQNFYVYFQELKQSTTTPPTDPFYPLFGTTFILNVPAFQTLNNIIYRNKSIYTIEIIDAMLNRNKSVTIDQQPIYIKIENISIQPYDFVISASGLDRTNNNVIHYISDSFPSSLTLHIGHLTTNSDTGVTAFYDANANVLNGSGEPILFDQQVYLAQIRFRIKQIHLF